jgi:hypothetical protein
MIFFSFLALYISNKFLLSLNKRINTENGQRQKQLHLHGQLLSNQLD